MSPAFDDEPPVFSLTHGGPFYRVLRRYRIITPTSTAGCWWLAILVWLPFIVGEAVRAAYDMPLDPALYDIATHVRVVFTLPILLISERLLETTSKSALATWRHGEFCDRTLSDPIFARAEQLRDSRFAELVCLLLALLGGLLVASGMLGATGLVYGGVEMQTWSFPRIWYAVIALPLVQFVMYRWIWRWLIWCYVLARLSRLPLRLIATHPDLAGGLSLLALPVGGIAGFLLGMSALLAAAWGTQVIFHHTTLPALLPGLLAFLIVATVVAIGPLLVFTVPLFRMRRRTLATYGTFARHYVLMFDEKWLAHPQGENVLGTSDIQSYADLGNVFQLAVKTRAFVFGPRVVLAVWFAVIVPMVPLFASSLTLEEVLKRIVTTVLGGFPL